MLSMTAFGRGCESNGQLTVNIDIRTVNGRYLDISIRAPRELSALESDIRKLVQNVLKRGRVDIYVNLEFSGGQQYQLNLPLLESYRELARQLRDSGVPGDIPAATLIQLPGVVSPRSVDSSSEDVCAVVLRAVESALEQVCQFRQKEGILLEADLRGRLDTLRGLIAEIEPLSEDLSGVYRQKLQEKLARLDAQEIVDESRLAAEVILLAERSDVTEEVTRLRAHLERFGELIEESAESIGRNLDFLCQEMNREMNTIVSKSSLADLSEIAVAGKVEIEKIREQVQNVE